VTAPHHLWLIGDGKPGHENQSLGLAEAIGRRTPCGISRISLAGYGGLFGRLRAAAAAAKDLPKPDFILAAGHATHPSLLWLARKCSARSVVLMRPSLPLRCFDHVIAPEHDFGQAAPPPNVILTKGALNRVLPSDGPRDGKLILLGGPSKIHGWDGPALLGMLAAATDRGGWELTDSRRTPPGFLGELRRDLPGISVVPHGETPPGWLPQRLAAAKEVWVTEDSVSMIYEALSSGARVGLLPVPRNVGNSRVLRGVDSLVASGFLTPFIAWRATGRLAHPPEHLSEADRCAEILVAGRENNSLLSRPEF